MFLLWLYSQKGWSISQMNSLRERNLKLEEEFMNFITLKSEHDLQVIKDMRIFDFEEISSMFRSFYAIF